MMMTAEHACDGSLAALPPRVWIVGPTGSGKSTLADNLGDRVARPVLHLDDVHWLPDWHENDHQSEVAAVKQFCREPSWIVEGNYKELRRVMLLHVDLFIWLDFPLRITFPRLIRRTFRRSLKHEPCCNGNHESLWRAFCSHESILLWSLTSHSRRRAGLETELLSRRVVRFRHPAELAAWAGGLLDSQTSS